MAVTIASVEAGSPADRAGIRAGEQLLTLNGHVIHDVLDYRFYETDAKVEVGLASPGGDTRTVVIRKSQYRPLGLEFTSYLMDQQRPCRNACIFCFVDQMPAGMRKTLYFKDDDTRMSFLFGNYVTLTNLSDWDVQRIIEMRISPINVSVHTTNPALRVKMMGNRFAGEVLSILPRLAQAGIRINTQCVLCPGINDGPELLRTLSDLERLLPALESVSLVPVGLTKFREGLPELRPYTQEEAGQVIDMADRFGDRFRDEYGRRTVYAADEFYLAAQRPIPPAEFYEDFCQLESGVGSLACLEEEFTLALEEWQESPQPLSAPRRVTLATGTAAYPFLCRLMERLEAVCPGLSCEVVEIVNHFFGETITVAGLVTGTDLIAQLKPRRMGECLLLPSVMLRHDGDLFLDDVSVQDVERELGVPVEPVPNDGQRLLDAVIGRDTTWQNPW